MTFGIRLYLGDLVVFMSTRLLIGLLTVVTSGCNGGEDTSSKAVITAKAPADTPPPFDPKWIPPAKGQGNFEICLSDEAAENGIKKVTVPKNLIFQSWGQMTGILMDSKAHDLRVMGAPTTSPLGAETTYAVITTAQVVLTVKEPCQITTARSVIHPGFRWTHELVPVSKHQNFAAESAKISNGKTSGKQWGYDENGLATAKDGPIGDAIQFGLLNGALLEDAVDPVILADE